MKGIVITTDGKVSVQDFEKPLYKSIGAVVGGYIEIVHPRRMNRPFTMVVNEEGLYLGLPINFFGSYFYETDIHGSPIVGNIVIVKEGFTDEGPDLVGLTDEDIETFLSQNSNILPMKEFYDSYRKEKENK